MDVCVICVVFLVDCRYLQGFVIIVSDDNSTNSSAPLCYVFSNGSSSTDYSLQGLDPTFTCNQPLIGRYATIRRQGGYQTRSMSLCNVRVNGFVSGSGRSLVLTFYVNLLKHSETYQNSKFYRNLSLQNNCMMA